MTDPETEKIEITPDLDASDIPSRAAGAREMGAKGALEDIPRLVEIAKTDKSTAIRLAAAAAAADILSRYRLDRAALGDAERASLLRSASSIDPGFNTGLFSVLAGLDTPAIFRRIANGLRDPRSGVRLGAAVGLKRLVTSISAFQDAAMEAQVVALFADKRMKPDALTELAQVCCAAGYISAIGPIENLSISGGLGETVEASLDRLLRFQENPVQGEFSSTGLDAGEVNPAKADDHQKVFFTASEFRMLPDGDWQPADPSAVRRMWLKPPGGSEDVDAFQWNGRTWYRVSDEALVTTIDGHLDVSKLDLDKALAGKPHGDGERLADALAAGLPDTGVGRYYRGILALMKGDPSEARHQLDAAAGHKKAPLEHHYFLGVLEIRSGEVEEGKERLDKYLKQGKGKGQFEAAAKAFVG